MHTITGRGNSMNQIQNYGVTDNPVFKVKIRSLATPYEQPANTAPENTEITFRVGMAVTGKDENEKIHTGKIVSYKREESIIIIIDSGSKKTIELDATTTTPVKNVHKIGSRDNPIIGEHYLSFEDFKSSNL